MRQFLFIVIVTVSMLRLATAQPTSRPIAQYTNAELIDRLVEVGNDGFSVQTNILPYGDATQGLPQGLRRLGDEGPKPAEAMDELVRRSVPAVADLLAHLDDARPTKAVVKGMFSGITYAAEYDWNRRTEKAPPNGVGGDPWDQSKPRINQAPQKNEYTVAVGDLCFEIVGRILARGYQLVRYQPTAIVIVNSPVLCPDLCAAVRSQWGGLTVERHRESLIADVSRPDRLSRDSGSLSVLWQIYPESVPAAVRARLQIPFYDARLVENFAQKTLYMTAERAERRRRIDEFLAKNGPAYEDGLILQLYEDRSIRAGTPYIFGANGPDPAPKASPKDILAEAFPGVVVGDQAPRFDSVTAGSTAFFIESMHGIASPEIDRAVWDAFSKHLGFKAEKIEGTDYIASSVAERLAHRGHDEELLAYCRRRRAEVVDEDKAYFDKLISTLEGKVSD